MFRQLLAILISVRDIQTKTHWLSRIRGIFFFGIGVVYWEKLLRYNSSLRKFAPFC